MNIYLISSETNGKKLYKIGITRREIEVRMKELKTGNAADLEIVDSFESKWGTKIESNLHKWFKSKKISGEWFELCQKDILEFKNRCKLLHENFELIESQNTYLIDKGGRF
jgi:hypothetical protein